MKKRSQRFKKSEDGQAIIEAILIIPLLFFMLLWMTQLFMAAQTSEVVQEKTRNHLMLSINNWRDLRGSDQHPPVIVDDPSKNWVIYGEGGKLVYGTQAPIKRKFGPEGSDKMDIKTELGICRTTNCR
ncbi:MAG TPA: TadE family protein [Bdellovibrionota bacterium]|nr:TadE family protein [Bdellovibrionota bacterium]